MFYCEQIMRFASCFYKDFTQHLNIFGIEHIHIYINK